MKNLKIPLFLIFSFLQLSNLNIIGKENYNFNTAWKFSKGEIVGAEKINYDDTKWENVNIPHDWAIAGPFDPLGESETAKLPWQGEGWYRKNFNIDKNLEGKKIYFMFDGIMAFPKIYINGKLAGEWDYGYNSFYIDATDYLSYGNENTIAIHVDTREHESRWYPGAGIYRKIQMIVANPIHIDVWGTYVSTPAVDDTWADVKILTSVRNDEFKEKLVTIESTVLSPLGNVVAVAKHEEKIQSNSKYEFEQWVTLTSPQRWDVDSPVLYTVKTIIKSNGIDSDTNYTKFGIRTFEFTANDGFHLNGRRLQIKGVNLHHDQGPLGAAFYKRSMQRQLEIMKEMGCNAIRTSHNMPAPELLELCDEMGFLVIDEAYDKWDRKGDFLPGKDFFESAERNITNFVKRDRNHPSIILWSIGNEMRDIQANANGSYNKLVEMISYFKKFDSSRPITMVNDNMESVKYRHYELIDVHSWNYGRRYLPARNAEPTKAVIISESASTVSTRGYYSLPLPKEKTDFSIDDLQVSSYDMNAPDWAEPAEFDFMWQEEDKYVAGEFVWTGFDYLGEPTPYNYSFRQEGKITKGQTAKSSYFGIVDLAGIPKDRYYLYQSHWVPEKTTIHILPHWNWEGKEGENIPVFVYTNGDKGELFLNGKSLGIKEKQPKSNNPFERYRLMWENVKYQPGELKVVAYKEGKIIGEKVIKTSGKPASIKLSPDRQILNRSGEDLSYILVEAFDSDGNFCPLAQNLLKFKIEGPAEIIGVGNGNPQSLEPFNSNERKLFYGKAMVVIRVLKNGEGEIKVEAESEGIKGDSVICKSIEF
ncbi:MAG: DUF4982 domain-containing protein [Bacteroidetes bacterium]|nr:DUF4982 domain-containing protein [Bacteroidota bacterium]MBU1116531.1 DUF4982 domain-containing protein [Bacteroidota bacterium]MBU1796848.1 DUF4982 domain-containing protein [Bacteroidota bacterium]